MNRCLLIVLITSLISLSSCFLVDEDQKNSEPPAILFDQEEDRISIHMVKESEYQLSILVQEGSSPFEFRLSHPNGEITSESFTGDSYTYSYTVPNDALVSEEPLVYTIVVVDSDDRFSNVLTFEVIVIDNKEFSVETEVITGSLIDFDAFNLSELSVVSSVEEVEIRDDGSFDIHTPENLSDDFIMITDAEDNLIAGIYSDPGSVQTVDATATAKLLVSFLPFTEFLATDDISNAIEELRHYQEFTVLEEAISSAIQSGIAPLSDQIVVTALGSLQDVVMEGSSSGRLKSIGDELDYIKINYMSGAIQLEGDNFFADLGVRFLNEAGETLDEGILNATKISSPSLNNFSSILAGNFDFVTNHSVVFVPSTEDRYIIEIIPPSYFQEDHLADDAMSANLTRISLQILNKFGIKDIVEDSCIQNILGLMKSLVIEGYESGGDMTQTAILNIFSTALKSNTVNVCLNRAPSKWLKTISNIMKKMANIQFYAQIGFSIKDLVDSEAATYFPHIYQGKMVGWFILVEDQDSQNQQVKVGDTLSLKIYALDEATEEVPLEDLNLCWYTDSNSKLLQPHSAFTDENGLSANQLKIVAGRNNEVKVFAIDHEGDTLEDIGNFNYHIDPVGNTFQCYVNGELINFECQMKTDVDHFDKKYISGLSPAYNVSFQFDQEVPANGTYIVDNENDIRDFTGGLWVRIRDDNTQCSGHYGSATGGLIDYATLTISRPQAGIIEGQFSIFNQDFQVTDGHFSLVEDFD